MEQEPRTVEDLTPEIMLLIGEIIKEIIPQKAGFALVLFDFGGELREFKYISNAERPDMLAAFEALMIKWKNEQANKTDVTDKPNEKEFAEAINKLGNLYEEGKNLIVRLLPAESFGEDYEAEGLYDLLREMRDIAAVNIQKVYH
jgi:hypothetical protein